MSHPPNIIAAAIQAATTDPDVQKLYANGFAIGMTNSDIQVILTLDAKPIGVLHLSYTLAKTLQARVGTVMAEFEAKTGRKILRTDEVDEAFKNEPAE